MAKKNKFYLTTPIYYVNDKPHIGHAYTTILADVLARYHRSAGDEVFFLTGLDEHGQKVQQAAEKRGVPPQQHCDEMAPRFIELWQRLNIQYDDFVRTTQDRHKSVVQACLKMLFDKGEIYTSEYEGSYSVAEERFITETEVKSGQFRDVKTLKEKNYFFRMGKYQQQLIDYIEKNPEFILPETRRNEILGFLKQPLGDLCISRPKARLSWGIELPFDKDYVTYVWFDALVNYISIPGYTTDKEKFGHWWPADLHLIGKDILTTHAVYWSTMLFALGLPLPKTIFAHGWWLIGETKMSKSLGNVVNPLDLIDQYGVDAVRYYLMAEMVLGQDANFTPELFIRRYNNDLANDFGNLLNRMSGLITKHFEGSVPAAGQATEAEQEIMEYGQKLPSAVKANIDQMKVQTAVDEIMGIVRKVNAYVEKQAPWSEMKKGNKERAGTILYIATEALRIAAVLLQPIMPVKAVEVLDVLGAVDSKPQWGLLKSGTVLKSHSALFPRIEVK
ncbi:MAG: methionine--tRNA ligase [Candidatus Omnitrophica bacterium]|nr:methionine--tRNA ligase [Candidatus Omnitrophota bacterium]